MLGTNFATYEPFYQDCGKIEQIYCILNYIFWFFDQIRVLRTVQINKIDLH